MALACTDVYSVERPSVIEAILENTLRTFTFLVDVHTCASTATRLTPLETCWTCICHNSGQPGGTAAITCFCLGHCPGNQLNRTCTAPPGAPCFSAAEEVVDPETDLLVPERTYGRLPRPPGASFPARKHCLLLRHPDSDKDPHFDWHFFHHVHDIALGQACSDEFYFARFCGYFSKA